MKKKIINMIQNINWYIQFNCILLKKIKCKVNLLKENDIEQYLIIVPHSDDELIGCYKFIKKNKHRTLLYYCGFTGSNPLIENKKNREQEFIKFCEENKVNYILSLGNLEKEIREIILQYNISTIMMPSCLDWHDEHREVNYILENIIDTGIKIKNVIWYFISVPKPESLIGHIIPMSKKDQTEKWEMFDYCYKTQSHMPIRRYKYIERIYAYNKKYFSGEIFTILDLDIWRKYLIRTKEKEVNLEIKKLKNNINDIYKIYHSSNEIFEKYYND